MKDGARELLLPSFLYLVGLLVGVPVSVRVLQVVYELLVRDALSVQSFWFELLRSLEVFRWFR